MSASISYDPNDQAKEDPDQVGHYFIDISRAIQNHQSQGEPTRVRNGHQESAWAKESKPEPPS